jgi:RNA polymerase sigma factor (sigma-70 family)
MMDTRSDLEALETIVGRIADGDPSAEAVLLEYLGPRLRVMMRAKTRDAELANDLAQDATIAVLQALRRGQLREPHRLIAFAHGVARNIVNNHRRGMSRDAGAGYEPLTESMAQPIDEIHAHERRDLVTRGLAALSLSDREILDLALVEGMKPGEIAARLQLAPEVVRTRKSRALKRVLAALGRLSGGPEPAEGES